jgi:hypothetical protein
MATLRPFLISSSTSRDSSATRALWALTSGLVPLRSWKKAWASSMTTTTTVARHGLRRAAVLSDGAIRLVHRFGLLDWPSFLGILAEQGPEAIIAQVRTAEGSNPDGQRWPRGKRHDDASAAFCRLT